MATVNFKVPFLVEKGVWYDKRGSVRRGYGWRYNINTHNVSKIALHHTVTPALGNMNKELAHLDSVTTRFGGIPYNIVIFTEKKNGYAKAAYVGDLGSARAHTPNKKGAFGIRKGHGNTYILSLAFIGDFSGGKLPSDAQLRTAHEIVKEFITNEGIRFPKINSWSDVRGHREFDYTYCPTSSLTKLKAKVKSPPKEVDVFEKKYKDLKKKFDSYKRTKGKEVDALKSTISELRKQIDNLSNRPTNEQYQKTVKKMQKEVARCEAALKDIETQKPTLKEAVSVVINKLKGFFRG